MLVWKYFSIHNILYFFLIESHVDALFAGKLNIGCRLDRAAEEKGQQKNQNVKGAQKILVLTSIYQGACVVSLEMSVFIKLQNLLIVLIHVFKDVLALTGALCVFTLDPRCANVCFHSTPTR